MGDNKLEEIMNEEGLSNSELARFAILTDKTIAKVRKNEDNSTITTKNKIIKGLNKNPEKLRDYSFEDIFPNNNETVYRKTK